VLTSLLPIWIRLNGAIQGRKPLKEVEMEIHIRWMIRRDMPEVLRIEERSFEFPWSEENFILCLSQRNCIGMVAEFDQQVMGFMIYELHKTRLRLLNFAVSPEFRRKLVGDSMVDKLKTKLSHARRNRIVLEVRESNIDAQMFFQSMGFTAVGVLSGFYDETKEDAYLMEFCHGNQVSLATRNRIEKYFQKNE